MNTKHCPFCDITFTYDKKNILLEKDSFIIICPVCKRKIKIKEEGTEK